MSEKGWFDQGWARAGLIPATGGLLYASQRAGRLAPWRLLLADRVDAATAEAWGLAIACPQAREAALEVARQLARLPQDALRALTRLTSITEPNEHMSKALDAQIGFLTASGYRAWVQQLLGKS
jgi:enoyl-CoA hydratase/carnithine racemase